MAGAWQVGQTWLKTVTALIQGTWAGAVGEKILFEGQMAGAWQVGQTWLKTVTALIPLKGVLKRVQGARAGAVGVNPRIRADFFGVPG